ncbi:MAG TPA: hypothetical protein VNT56_05715 [Acidimicrobiales bacterium]|nr:hypothetical protein [Acidimicrobiales bacterium]
MTTTVAGEAARYLDAVRTQLGDLAADERQEVLEDLAVHLEEVAADADGPLEQILGRPEDFVAELRASAGMAGPGPDRPGGGVAAARDRLGTWRQAAAGSRAGRWIDALLPELAPGWWVLRGYLAVLALSVLGGEHHFPHFPVPTLLGSSVFGLAAVAAAAVASVQLGRRHRQVGRPWTITAGEVLLVLGTMIALGQLRGAVGPQYVFADPAPIHSGSLTYPDGSPITNLFPYGSDGRLLDGVLLYDQDGRPVSLAGGEPVNPYDDRLQTDYRLDANGAEVPNLYPLDQQLREYRYGPQGESVVTEPVRPPAISPPRLAPTTTTASPATTSTSAAPATTATTAPAPAG